MTPIKSTRSAHFDASCTCMHLDLNVKAPSAHEKEPYQKNYYLCMNEIKTLTHNFYRKQVNYSPSVQNSRHIRNVSQKSLGTNKENKLTRSSLVRRGVFHLKENVTPMRNFQRTSWHHEVLIECFYQVLFVSSTWKIIDQSSIKKLHQTEKGEKLHKCLW